MSRFTATVESSAALVSGATTGSTANGWFASVVSGATANYKLRRATLGCIAGTGAPSSQQIQVAIFRQTTRATGSLTTASGAACDPRSAASAIQGMHTAFTGSAPILGANPMARFTFNTQSGYDIPDELLEEWICDQTTANGLSFVNMDNALPTSHKLTLFA